MQDDCKLMLKEAADELFALSLILMMLEKGVTIEGNLAELGLASVGRCQKLVHRGLGIDEGPVRH